MADFSCSTTIYMARIDARFFKSKYSPQNILHLKTPPFGLWRIETSDLEVCWLTACIYILYTICIYIATDWNLECRIKVPKQKNNLIKNDTHGWHSKFQSDTHETPRMSLKINIACHCDTTQVMAGILNSIYNRMDFKNALTYTIPSSKKRLIHTSLIGSSPQGGEMKPPAQSLSAFIPFLSPKHGLRRARVLWLRRGLRHGARSSRRSTYLNWHVKSILQRSCRQAIWKKEWVKMGIFAKQSY